MTGQIEWGRLRRGRRWHILTGTEEPWCDADLGRPLEVTAGLPPRGGIPCPRCGDRALELADAVQTALAAASDHEGPTEDVHEHPTAAVRAVDPRSDSLSRQDQTG